MVQRFSEDLPEAAALRELERVARHLHDAEVIAYQWHARARFWRALSGVFAMALAVLVLAVVVGGCGGASHVVAMADGGDLDAAHVVDAGELDAAHVDGATSTPCVVAGSATGAPWGPGYYAPAVQWCGPLGCVWRVWAKPPPSYVLATADGDTAAHALASMPSGTMAEATSLATAKALATSRAASIGGACP